MYFINIPNPLTTSSIDITILIFCDNLNVSGTFSIVVSPLDLSNHTAYSFITLLPSLDTIVTTASSEYATSPSGVVLHPTNS